MLVSCRLHFQGGHETDNDGNAVESLALEPAPTLSMPTEGRAKCGAGTGLIEKPDFQRTMDSSGGRDVTVTTSLSLSVTIILAEMATQDQDFSPTTS